MMRLIYFIILIGMLIAGLIVGAPLSFAMKTSGLANSGVSWQQARGTLWNGQITGLGYLNYNLGTVEISASPMSLLAGGISGEFDWRSSSGMANGYLKATKHSVRARQLDANIFVQALDDLHPELRRTGGTLSFKDTSLELNASGKCVAANGQSKLDLLQRVGEQYGRDWPILSGEVKCENGGIVVPLRGTGGNQETFEVNLTYDGVSTIALSILTEGLDAETTITLQAIGFQPSGNGFGYTQTTDFRELR